MAFDPASLKRLIGMTEKAKLVSLDKSTDNFELEFNPEKGSLELTRRVNWQFPPGLDAESAGGIANFAGSDADELSFTTLLDDTTGGAAAYAAAAGKSALAATLTLAVDQSTTLVTNKRLLALSGMDLGVGVADSVAEALLRTLSRSSVHKQIKKLYFLTTPDAVTGPRKRPSIVKFKWGDFDFVGVIIRLNVQYLVVTEGGYPKRAKVQMSLYGRSFVGDVTADKFIVPDPWTRPTSLLP
jgi:hypothetical protein